MSGHGAMVQVAGRPAVVMDSVQVACPGDAATRLNKPVMVPVPEPANFAVVLSTDQAK